mgnify:CR=1 FL=1
MTEIQALLLIKSILELMSSKLELRFKRLQTLSHKSL